MKYLLDTNIVVDHLRGKRIIADKWIVAGYGLSVVSVMELWHGAFKSNRVERNLLEIEKVVDNSQTSCLVVDLRVGRCFSKLKAELEKQGRRRDNFDLLIAATAVVHGLVLVTKNKKHFDGVEGLVLEE